MAKYCDYFIEKSNKYFCILKDSEISNDTYKEYCKCDETKKCPIFQYFDKEKRR